MVRTIGRALLDFARVMRPGRETGRRRPPAGATPRSGLALVAALVLLAAGGCGRNADEPRPSADPAEATGASTELAERRDGAGIADFDARIRRADVNGDALPDMIFRKSDNTIWVSLAESSGFGALGRWAAPGGAWKADQAFLVDVDGDGKMDLVFRDAANRIGAHLSTGTAFARPTTWLALGGDYVAGQVQFADVDGDGMSDLIFREIIAECSTTNVNGDMCPAGLDQVDMTCGTRLVHCGRDEQCERRVCSVQCQTCNTSESLKVGISTGSAFQALQDW